MRLARLSFLFALLVNHHIYALIVIANPPSGTMTAINLLDRITYLKSLSDYYTCGIENNGANLYSIIRVKLLDTTRIFSLALAPYTFTNAGVTQNIPGTITFTSDSSYSYIKVSIPVSALTDANACYEYTNTTTYVGRLCNLKLDFLATDLSASLLTIAYSLGVQINKKTQVATSLGISKINKNGCNCTVNDTFPVTVQMFSDTACTVPLNTSAVVVGSHICLKLTSSSAEASIFHFDLAEVLILNA